MSKKKFTFIDLFAGCGGFSEGFYQEGFKSIVHVDFDAPACETVKERMRYYKYSEESIINAVICGDLTSEDVHNQIDNVIGNTEIDVLVGGPPCQSFSSVGRAQDKNSMRNDPRNYLFRSYLEILEKHKPKIFVFENVSGLLSAKPNGNYIFPEIIESMSEFYSVCDDRETILLNSVHYGVPQIRKRVILIGVRKDLNIKSEDVYKAIIKTHFSPEMESKNEVLGFKKYLTVKDAISDLPKLYPGEGEEEIFHKIEKKNSYLKIMRPNGSTKLFNHVARKHNDLDRERYKLLSKNNWQLKELAEVRPDLIHHDPKHFGNRYTVQTATKPGRTVVAHLYKDGNLFIHPDYKQERTFTVREAARIQSFPDDFKFVGSRTNQFKQVGNAVPPLMAKQIAKAIKQFI
ncbi:DNA cytosine methyltransferase [Winogradskyella sp. Asnod2-B02-A]|uniref:DNA cytosine methyltransferase n=1 Tax=Winogradskyella sp. Asnod2-B02-A TaxID=3160583 RepID=UPI00386EEC8D